MRNSLTKLSARWLDLANRSPLRQLGHASLIAASTSFAAKGVGFAKEIVVATIFGISDALDVYLLAFVLIAFPVNVLLNAFQTPTVASLSVRQDNADRDGETFTTTLIAVTLLIAVVLPFWMLVLNALLSRIAAGFSAAKLVWLDQALMALLLYYFLNGINLLGYGVLQARRHYVVNGLLPVLTPLVTIPIVLTYGAASSWSVLVWALTLGAALECLAINVFVVRAGLYRLPNFHGQAFADIMRGGAMLLPGTLIMAIGAVAEQSIAAALDSGAVAALAYGNRLPAALNGIVITAVGTTVLPYFALLIAEGKRSYCIHSLKKIARWLVVLGGLAGIALVLTSELIVTVFYERGMFDAAATARVFPVQQVYFLQLPFVLLGTLAIRTLLALRHNGIVSLLAGFGVAIHIALAFTLSDRYGPVGIAWGATVSTIFIALAGFALAWRTLKE